MHPEIKKFFEEKYQVTVINLQQWSDDPADAQCYWCISSENTVATVMAATLNNGENKYVFNGYWYSEDEALKMIKLKAFF